MEKRDVVSTGNGILLRKDVRTQATTRTTWEDIALRETSHLQRDPRYGIQSVTCTEAESGMVAARGWGEGGMGSYCLVGADFQFCKMKRSGDGRGPWLHNRVSVPTPRNCMLKMALRPGAPGWLSRCSMQLLIAASRVRAP